MKMNDESEKQNMWTCPKCSKINSEDRIFCPHCGQRRYRSDSALHDDFEPENTAVTEEKPAHSVNTVIVGLVILLILAATALMIFGIVRLSEKNRAEREANSASFVIGGETASNSGSSEVVIVTPAPTAASTETAATPNPTATPEPTVTPTPDINAPAISISGQSVPGNMEQGSKFDVRGDILVNVGTITSVSCEILDTNETVVMSKKVYPAVKEYQLLDSELDNSMHFAQLRAGTYTYVIKATAMNGSATSEQTLVRSKFNITLNGSVVEGGTNTTSGLNGANVGTLTGDGVNFRKGPGGDYEILDSLPRGTTIQILETYESGWMKCYVNGLTGYIYGDFVSVG